MRTKEELSHSAQIITDIIKNTPSEQRWELYTRISEKLFMQTQNYQASHFMALAQAETQGGSVYVKVRPK